MKSPNEINFKDLEQIVCPYDRCLVRGNYWRCYFKDTKEWNYRNCEIFKQYTRAHKGL